jgi:GNAT superfamily N-acetyltransferase|tara:strand:+ start:402 stop:983 length:582 start_codon:yes stop_codon:yes gene_type:complete
MEIPKVNNVDDSKAEEVKAAITLGFTADPLIRWIFPDPQKYLRSFAVWMDEFSKPAFENGGVFADENYYGGSLWHPPGIHLDSEILAPTFADIPEERVEHVVQFFDELGKYHPDEDHWYLAFIALDPSKQGQGLGSLILKEALKVVDEQGKIAYLESSNPKNMTLYERHGFETMGRVEFGDSPPAHPMIRYPR